MLNKMNTFLTN